MFHGHAGNGGTIGHAYEGDLKIQFGILCNGSAFEPWQLRCVEQLLAVTDIRAVLLITLNVSALRSRPLPEYLASLPTVMIPGTPAGTDHTSGAEPAVEKIRGHDLDFILSFVVESCPPNLLETARYGIWAYHFGDWTRYRGGPPGFWEVYEAEPVSAALLVRLQRDADSVAVLRQGHLRTNLLSCEGNRQQLYARFTQWPAQVCVEIRSGITHLFTERPVVSTAAQRAAPTSAQRLLCMLRIAWRMAGEGWRSLFRHDHWNFARVDRPIASFLYADHAGPIQWLPRPRSSEFQADPFGVLRDGRLIVFFEHFSYRSNRGTIATIDPANGEGRTAVNIGPEPAVHLSYPYLLEVEGRLLCIPETHEAREIALYEVERFPDQWVKVANLVEGIPIVDATLFRHEGTWWLAGSEPTSKGASCELHLWYANAIEGPWHPHAGNPVKIDIRSARPGGTPFYENGILYRPAQDCSRSYGGRIIINRVVALSPTTFCETQAAIVEPDPMGPYPDGLHTLAQVGDITLIDGNRFIFSPVEFRRVLIHYARSALKRARRILW
jgi:hypothetical protein